MIIIINELI